MSVRQGHRFEAEPSLRVHLDAAGTEPYASKAIVLKAWAQASAPATFRADWCRQLWEAVRGSEQSRVEVMIIETSTRSFSKASSMFRSFASALDALLVSQDDIATLATVSRMSRSHIACASCP